MDIYQTIKNYCLLYNSATAIFCATHNFHAMYRHIILVTLVILPTILCGVIMDAVEDSSPPDEQSVRSLKEMLDEIPKNRYSWVDRNAGTIPYKCSFIYGGGFNRLLYVGRVWSGNDVIPAAIHHYGRGGTETVRFIKEANVNVQTDVQWLCDNNNTVSWLRVKDLSDSTLKRVNALPIGYDSKRKSLTYGCIVHSFFSDQYPTSLGLVINGTCEFEIQGTIVNTSKFTWWHTLEVLITTV